MWRWFTVTIILYVCSVRGAFQVKGALRVNLYASTILYLFCILYLFDWFSVLSINSVCLSAVCPRFPFVFPVFLYSHPRSVSVGWRIAVKSWRSNSAISDFQSVQTAHALKNSTSSFWPKYSLPSRVTVRWLQISNITWLLEIDFKGDQVEAFRYQFLQVFSDVLSDQVAPEHVTFQRYDSDFQDFVDIPDGGKLEKGGKLKAIVSKSDKKQVSAPLVLRNLSVDMT